MCGSRPSMQSAHTDLRDGQALRIACAESDIAGRIVRDRRGMRITAREKQTRSGTIDLYGTDRNHTPAIIEIRRSQPHHPQCSNYLLDLKHRHTHTMRIRGIPCAPKHSCHDNDNARRSHHAVVSANVLAECLVAHSATDRDVHRPEIER